MAGGDTNSSFQIFESRTTVVVAQDAPEQHLPNWVEMLADRVEQEDPRDHYFSTRSPHLLAAIVLGQDVEVASAFCILHSQGAVVEVTVYPESGYNNQ